MSHRVVLSARARRDLARISQFLDVRNPGAARRAVQAIEDAAASLADFPGRGRAGPNESLRAVTAPFGRDGYIIQYRVEPNVVVVARIFHNREDR